jgi:hypothetical protein
MVFVGHVGLRLPTTHPFATVMSPAIESEVHFIVIAGMRWEKTILKVKSCM